MSATPSDSRERAASIALDDLAETLDLDPGREDRFRAMPDDAAALEQLPEIPGFTIESKIGEGAFGEVYRARDELLGRDVALKIPLPHLRFSRSARESFLREARALARVRHPNVLTIFGVLELEDDQLVLVTEYVRGDSLESSLARHGPLPAREVARIGISVCRALRAVHEAGLVHRDLKTANLLREENGRIVLADFGLGLSREHHGETSDDAGRIAGSPLFMAPEQVRGDGVDERTDIYTLGVALYHLVTGHYPVVRDDLHELLRAIEVEEFQPPHQLRPDVPRTFTSVLAKALAKDPRQRFQNAREMERALTRFLEGRVDELRAERN